MVKALNILIGIVVFIIAAYFIFCIAASAIHVYRFMTGKVSKEEQERLMELHKREQERKRQEKEEQRRRWKHLEISFISITVKPMGTLALIQLISKKL